MPVLRKAPNVACHYTGHTLIFQMTTNELQDRLYEFIGQTYPDIKIEVIDTVDNSRQLYFTETKFKDLFPKQRYHYLIHLIPSDFFDKHLQDTQWFELAPGETPDDLDYHDQETIDKIKDTILSVLKDKVNFVSLLDTTFASGQEKCHGDFRHSKNILTTLNFPDHAQFDIFHVLMDGGAYCDCEILLNVFTDSEYAKKYWKQRDE